MNETRRCSNDNCEYEFEVSVPFSKTRKMGNLTATTILNLRLHYDGVYVPRPGGVFFYPICPECGHVQLHISRLDV